MEEQVIIYNRKLMRQKATLERNLKTISNEIENLQESCNHIRVCLGWDGAYQYRDTSVFNCLLCRDYDPDTKYKTLDATNYKKMQYSHGQNESYRESRLLELQNLALAIIIENPSITEEELIEKIENIIKKDEQETKKLEKSLGHKIG